MNRIAYSTYKSVEFETYYAFLPHNIDDVLQIDEQSTIKFGDQLTVDDTNSSTAHHSTSKEQNYNQRPDQYTTEVRTCTELLESKKSILPCTER